MVCYLGHWKHFTSLQCFELVWSDVNYFVNEIITCRIIRMIIGNIHLLLFMGCATNVT